MRSSVAVLVLLCCAVVISSNEVTDQLHYADEESIKNEIQTEDQETEATVSNQKPCQSDIHTVLRELSTKLAEQSVELKYTKNQLEELKKQNEAAEIRLKASEKQVEELKRENEGQAQELRSLQMSLNITESQVRKLRRENECIFTAPVRGVYMFRFSITGSGSTSVPVGARLYKNGRHVVIAYCQQPSYLVSTTNGASLLLEVGDVVYVQLYPNTQTIDNGNHYNTFSGQLLFTA
ncbi:hypothetical protein MHYP_G00242740 [Metynnis hypsauchen]